MIRFLLLVCLLTGFLTSTSSVAQTQNTPAPDYQTTEAYQRSGYDFLWSVVQDEIDSQSFKTEADAKQYQDLIDHWIRIGSNYGKDTAETGKEMHTLYLQLLKLHDPPPLYVQYRYHNSQSGPNQSPEKYLKHGNALLVVAYQMDNADYPLYIAGTTWLKAAQLLEKAGNKNDQSSVAAATKHGIEQLVKAASMDGINPKYHEYLSLRIAYHGFQYTTLQRNDQITLCKLLLADEKADPWIGRFSSGGLRIKLAWDARSSGYAKDVSEEQWAGMRKHLIKAHKHLTKAWELRPAWPYPATSLITATMGHQIRTDRDVDFWFSEAIEARIDHYAAYSNFMYALTPKWGGSSEQMYQVIRFIIGLSEEQSNMGRVLLKSVSTFSELYQEPTQILVDESLLPHLTQLMLDEVDGDSQYHEVKWQRKSLRSVAFGNFEVQNYHESSKLLREGGAMTDSGWSTWEESSKFYRFAPLLGSPAYEEVIQGLESLDNNNTKAARTHFIKARKLLKKNRSKLNPKLIPDPLKMIDRTIELIQ